MSVDVSDISGIGGASALPRFIFTNNALAFPLVALSSIELIDSISPSIALLTAMEKICSGVSSGLLPPDEGAVSEISGMGGLSALPRFILIMRAFALPRVTLSVNALSGSMSPSSALLTTFAIICSRLRPASAVAELVGTESSAGFSGMGGVSPVRFALTSLAFANPLVGLSGIALITSILFCNPILTA